MQNNAENINEESAVSKKWIVYKHTSPSGKVYVGITSKKDPRDRWGYGGCMYKYNVLFWKAIQKYGWDNIKHEVICENMEEMDAKNMEIELIAQYKSIGMSYNLSDGGDGVTGPMNQDQKDHISAALKGKKKTEEHARKVRESLKSKHYKFIWVHNEYEEKRVHERDLDKYADWEIGRLWSPSKEAREKISKAFDGRHLTQEHKGKVSSSLIGKKKGYVNMNDGEFNYCVPPDAVQKCLDAGWKHGYMKDDDRFNKTWIHKGNEELKIYWSELKNYPGWVTGRRKNGSKLYNEERRRRLNAVLNSSE